MLGLFMSQVLLFGLAIVLLTIFFFIVRDGKVECTEPRLAVLWIEIAMMLGTLALAGYNLVKLCR